MIRDITAGVPSILLRHELYVTAALVAASLYVILISQGMPDPWSALIGFVAGFSLRAATIRFGLRLRPHRG